MQTPSTSPTTTPADDPHHALAQAQRLLACFQQALGHELPNQLVAIQGLARLVNEDPAERLSPDLKAGLGRLADLTRRIHLLVAALADTGRTCRRQEEPAAVVLEECCREAAAEVKWLYPGRVTGCACGGPHRLLVAPPVAFRRVVTEVFVFAVRRLGPGQTLTMAVEACDVDGPGVEVRARGDGPPLSAGQVEAAFDPFGTAPDDRRPSLGLFLARQLAEGWGGSFQLLPDPQGFRCLFSLPWPSVSSGVPPSARTPREIAQ